MNAAIDIGSNTVLLLVGEHRAGNVTVIYEEQHAPRLGQGVDAEKNLAHHSIDRVLKVLHRYKSIIQEEYQNISKVDVLATSAVRDANNKQVFIERVAEETGFSVQILSGEEEAELTYAGALSVLEESSGPSAVIDIGGGSTEIALGKGQHMMDRFSFDMGSVRFTERYLVNNPPSQKQIKQCKIAIKKVLEQRAFNWTQTPRLVGVAGTVTSLAAIHKKVDRYDPKLLNGVILSAEDVSSQIAEFSTMTGEELLRQYPNFLKGRADIILAGLLILQRFMQFYDVEQLTTSTGGIRHGALLMG